MKNILFVFLFLFTGNVFSQDLDCKQFKNGKYFLEIKDVGSYIITRNGKEQTEYAEQSGFELLFDVKWIDECTYTLKLKKILKNPNNEQFPWGMIVTVEIIETKENSYIQRTSSNETDFQIVDEMTRIK